MTAPDVPRTTAGRALLETCRDTGFDAEGDTAWWRDRIIAIEAEAAAGGLDVERLACLLHDAMVEWIGIFSERGPQYAEPSWADTKAASIAAEYARLATQEEGA